MLVCDCGVVPAGYKNLQYIMTLYCVGLDPLPYQDRQERQRELDDLTARRAATKIAAICRGRMSRSLKQKREEAAAGGKNLAPMKKRLFNERFVRVMQSPEEQERLKLAVHQAHREMGKDGSPVKYKHKSPSNSHRADKSPTSSMELRTPEASAEVTAAVAEIPPAAPAQIDTQNVDKIKNMFQARANKRRELREQRRQELELVAAAEAAEAAAAAETAAEMEAVEDLGSADADGAGESEVGAPP